MKNSLGSFAILPISCLLMSLVLLAGTPSLSACRSSSAEQESGQEVVVKDSDAPAQDAASDADQATWLLAKTVTTYTYEDSSSEFTTVYERDEHGNIVKQIESDDNDYIQTSTYTLDDQGFITSVTYESSYGDSSETTYKCTTDDAGRLVRREAEDGSSIDEYTYDADGNRTQAVLTRVYTSYDEETGESSQETRVITYTYDADGFEVSYRNVGEGYVNASETTYERDGDGRVTKGTTISWSEDAEGNAFDDSKTTSTVTYTYDDAGNISRCDYESDGNAWSSVFEWVQVDEPSVVAASDGHVKP